MASFYVLEVHAGDVRGDTEFTEEAPWNRTEPSVCSACGQYLGQMVWLPPFHAELECWDREFGDLALGSGENMLVSDRFKRLYERWSLTGLHGFEPVTVVRVKRRERFKGDPPPYFHVRVGRAEAAIDLQRSGFVWAEPEKVCSVCREGGGIWRWKRIVIEDGTWAGEDIFIPRGLPVTVTSERFKEFCDKEEITNAVLVPAEQYSKDLEPWRNHEKAHELLASPLGPTLHEKIKPDGEIWRYDSEGNYVVVAGPDGEVRQIFRPVDGVEFWEHQ